MTASTRRVALVIATTEYDDQRLLRLGAPLSDALELARTLNEHGDFEVETLVNAEAQTVQRRIERFCKTGRERSDTILVYLTGHGVKDDDGNLYFALRDTDRDLLRTTAVSADLIAAVMDESPARSQMLMLDCCYSGAFARALRPKGQEDAGLAQRFASAPGARGRVVLAASGAIEPAWEEDTGSIYTRAVVEGIRTGSADLDSDGRITARELHTHVSDVLRQEGRQTPRKFEFDDAGELLLARTSVESKLMPAQKREEPIAPRQPISPEKKVSPWVLILVATVVVSVLTVWWLNRNSEQPSVSGPGSVDWQLVLDETFASNESGWTEGEVADGSSSFRLVGGAYEAISSSVETDEAFYSVIPSGARSETVYLETEATSLVPGSRCGLALQAAAGHLLVVGLGQSEVRSLLYVDGSVASASTFPVEQSEATETQFGLWLNDIVITVYVDDSVVASFDQPELNRVAQVGIGLMGGPEAHCSFDYLVALEG